MISILREEVVIATSYEYAYKGVHMGEKTVSVTVYSDDSIDFYEGDKVLFEDEYYFLNYTPTGSRKNSDQKIEYELVFEHIVFNLGNVSFLDVVPYGDDSETHYTGLGEVSFYGNVKTLCNRIKANLDRVFPGEWQFYFDPGIVLDEKEVLLSNQYCADALVLVNTLFELNYYITNKVITIGGTSTLIGGVYEYGKNKGLCEITRTAVTSDKLVTRLRAYGANKNLPKDYNKRSEDDGRYIPSLMLPDFVATGIDYIDSTNIDLNNIKEGVQTFEDIYPSIEGATDDLGVALDEILSVETITNPETDPSVVVHIRDIGFDINDYLTSVDALMAMKTGKLGGYEFIINKVEKEVNGYKITLVRNTDDESFPLPNNVTAIEAGDKFVLLEIYMPDTYVKYAETRLLERSQVWLSEHDFPKTSYSAKFSELYIVRNSGLLNSVKEGNRIRIIDAKLGVDKDILIQDVSKTFTEDNLPQLDLGISDEVVASVLTKISEEINRQDQNTQITYNRSVRDTRRNSKNLNTISEYLLDPNGEFDSDIIKPRSIKTLSLEAGAVASNYILESYVIPNYNGDPKKLLCQEGTLIHLEDFSWGYDTNTVNYIWNISIGTIYLPANSSAYYLYLKADRLQPNATWIFSEVGIPVDDDPDWYYFPWGIVFPVLDEKRTVQSTKGKSYIIGDQIYAGKIQDVSTFNYMDLSFGKFRFGGDPGVEGYSEISWNVENGVLKIIGGKMTAPEIEGGTIRGGEIIGSEIKTSETNPKIILNEDGGNDIKLYDSDGNVAMIIDDVAVDVNGVKYPGISMEGNGSLVNKVKLGLTGLYVAASRAHVGAYPEQRMAASFYGYDNRQKVYPSGSEVEYIAGAVFKAYNEATVNPVITYAAVFEDDVRFFADIYVGTPNDRKVGISKTVTFSTFDLGVETEHTITYTNGIVTQHDEVIIDNP